MKRNAMTGMKPDRYNQTLDQYDTLSEWKTKWSSTSYKFWAFCRWKLVAKTDGQTAHFPSCLTSLLK